MVGEILKKRREELGQDLKEIAHILKIRYDYLKAIEDEAFEKLPVEVYAKGYIREYAKILDIDPEVVIKAYTQDILPLEKSSVLPEGFIAEKKLNVRYLFIPVLAAVVVISALFFLSIKESKKIHKESGAGVQNKNIANNSSVPLTGEPQRAPVQHTLEVFATDTTWLHVRMDEGKSEEVLLKPGESASWTSRQGFFLKIGNAGGIKIVFDGKEIGAPGEKGQVVRLNLPEMKIPE